MAERGRPRAFNSVEELESKINDYFEYCNKENKPYTMSGLAYYLDVDRKTIVNYTKEEDFSYYPKEYKFPVSVSLEKKYARNQDGKIFPIISKETKYDDGSILIQPYVDIYEEDI